jgi:integral membrane protein (TIGR00529 family)
VLGFALEETGLMTRFIEGLSSILPSSILLATIPALFGFLSMPGGALMSAPFIEPEANKLGLEPEHKTYFNVWFRHLLYWINPVTSSTIMATTLSGFTINNWLKVQWPLFLVMVGIGLFFSRKFISSYKSRSSKGEFTMDDAKGIIPIIVTVALTLYGFEVGFCLTVGIILTFVLGRVKPTEAASMILKGLKWNTALAAFSTLYLRDMILHSGSVNSLFTVIIEAGVSRIAIAVLVPLLIGSISGSPTMGVGISFPLLLPLFSDPNIHIVSIIFVGIICTYITSPIHLCLVLSNSYYKSDLNKVIRYLAPSGAALYILGVAYHLFLNAIK